MSVKAERRERKRKPEMAESLGEGEFKQTPKLEGSTLGPGRPAQEPAPTQPPPPEPVTAPGGPAQGSREARALRLKEELEKRGLYFSDDVIALLEAKLNSNRRAFLLRGPAGVGKTSLASAIAELLNAELVFYQSTQGTSEEDLLYKYIPSENTKSGIKITLGPLPLALISSQTRPTVLLIDEFDKTRPSADALLLDFLQNYRLALFIDEKKQVIQGKPENLIIFLTSNDMREFSEPLLRRLTVLELKPLPTSKVYELLSKRFNKELAIMLAQIYDDTIKAGLRKPATIQELYELGEILEKNPNLPLDFLVRSLVVKYDDDWQKFVSYVSQRKPYQFAVSPPSGSSEVAAAYKPPEDEEISPPPQSESNTSESDTTTTAESILSEIRRKFVVKGVKAEPAAKPLPSDEKEVEVYAVLDNSDYKAYTDIVKDLRPEPGDDPSKLGKFEAYGNVIVAKEPLDINEVKRLLLYNNNPPKGEYYYEGEWLMSPNDIDSLIRKANRIYYYTRNRFVAKFIHGLSQDSNEETVEVEIIDRYTFGDKTYYWVRIRGHLKLSKDNKSIVMDLQEHNYIVAKNTCELLNLVKVMKSRARPGYSFHVRLDVTDDEYSRYSYGTLYISRADLNLLGVSEEDLKRLNHNVYEALEMFEARLGGVASCHSR